MMPMSLLSAALRRKLPNNAIDPLSTSTYTERPLALLDLTLLGIGGTLGSGLFLLAGRAARDIAGPAVTLSFATAAIACMFSGLSYAEMASRNPNSGGAYAFAYGALGELPAFLVGMCLTLEYGVSAAAVARSFSSYLGEALLFLPDWTVGRGGTVDFLASLLVVSLSMLLSVGMRQAKWIINGATVLYALVVFMIIALGSGKVNTENWKPFSPFGVEGVIAGASAVFFAFVGFDEVATVSEEAQDAARNVPLAILLSLAAVTGMYIASSFVLTGLVNYTLINTDAPFSVALRDVGLRTGAKLVGFGTALGMMNTTTVSLAAQPRIFVSMGRDGLLPRAVAFSMRFTTIGCGAIVAVLAFFIETQSLADVVSGGTLLAFLATNVSLLLTRCRIHSNARRGTYLIYFFVAGCVVVSFVNRLVTEGYLPFNVALLFSVPALLIPVAFLLPVDFQGGDMVEGSSPMFLCPLVPTVPLLGVFTTCFLLFQLSRAALSALCSWLTISSMCYFCYGARNAIIANEYRGIENDAANNSYNSFENIAMEAHSVMSDSLPGSPPPPLEKIEEVAGR